MKTDPRISRIRGMERRFDKVKAALNDIAILRQYMDSGLWNLLEEFGQPKA